MDIYEQKLTKLQNEIFRLFCIKAGQKLNNRQIAKLLKVSPTAVAKALPLLEKESLIKTSKIGEINLNSVELDLNQKTMQLKRTENLKLIYESGLSSFLDEKFPRITIILFGSFSRGDDNFKSDIDIAIIGLKETKMNLENFEKILEKKINLSFYNSFNIHKHLKENICNGIVLKGGIEL